MVHNKFIMKKVLITGAMGFVGSHLLEHVLKTTDWKIVALDRLDTSGNPNRVVDIDCWEEQKHRVKVVFWDLKAEINEQTQKQLGGPFDYIIHLAAGSHVDRSIEDPVLFFMDNAIGTVNLLQYARFGGLRPIMEEMEAHEDGEPVNVEVGIKGKFLYFSTDEVFGPAPMEESFVGFKEWDRLNPNNPYAAAKAAAEMAVISFANTYRIPCVMTNTMNIFGERQHPEKFIPLIIKSVLNGEKIYIHANKEKTQAGKRHYLHARNICSATLWTLENGSVLDGSAKKGRYNVVGEVEMDNLSLAKLISKLVHEVVPKAPDLSYELVDFHSSRPGHDLRYALDGSLLASEGFKYPVDFEESLRKMVRWTLAHPNWL
jgi:dTDP-glucose 4,6-dehydratase